MVSCQTCWPLDQWGGSIKVYCCKCLFTLIILCHDSPTRMVFHIHMSQERGEQSPFQYNCDIRLSIALSLSLLVILIRKFIWNCTYPNSLWCWVGTNPEYYMGYEIRRNMLTANPMQGQVWCCQIWGRLRRREENHRSGSVAVDNKQSNKYNKNVSQQIGISWFIPTIVLYSHAIVYTQKIRY